MATNLRLRPAAEKALRERAASTGRSQQQLIRDALDRYLGLDAGDETPARRPSLDDLRARGVLIPAREPARRAEKLLEMDGRPSSLELLDRDDRF